MSSDEHAKPESTESDAKSSDAGMHLVINPYQPIVYVDGAVLNPANGMVELMLTKVNLTSAPDPDGSGNNTVQGRFIMQMETFSRIAKLFKDQSEKLNNE